MTQTTRGNAQLTAPIDQGHISILLAQLGSIAQRVSHRLQIEPQNDRLLGDTKAAQF